MDLSKLLCSESPLPHQENEGNMNQSSGFGERADEFAYTHSEWRLPHGKAHGCQVWLSRAWALRASCWVQEEAVGCGGELGQIRILNVVLRKWHTFHWP